MDASISESTEATSNQINAELKLLRDRNFNLIERNSELRRQLQDLSQIEELNWKKDFEIQELRNSEVSHIKTIETLQTEYENQKKKLHENENTILNLENILKNQKIDLIATKDELHLQKSEFEILQKEHKFLQNKIKDLNDNIEKLEKLTAEQQFNFANEKESLYRQISTIADTNWKKDLDIEELCKVNANLKNEVEQLKNENSKQDKKICEASELIFDLKRAFEKQQNDLLKREENDSQKNKELDLLRNTSLKLNNEIESMRIYGSELTIEIEKHRNSEERLFEELQVLRAENEKYRKMHLDFDESLSKLKFSFEEQQRKFIEDDKLSKQQIFNLNEKNANKDIELDKFLRTEKELAFEIKKLQNTNSEQEQKFKETEKVLVLLKNLLKEQQADLNKYTESSNQRILDLTSSLNETQTERDMLRQLLDAKNLEISEYSQQQVSEMSSKLTKIQSERDLFCKETENLKLLLGIESKKNQSMEEQFKFREQQTQQYIFTLSQEHAEMKRQLKQITTENQIAKAKRPLKDCLSFIESELSKIDQLDKESGSEQKSL